MAEHAVDFVVSLGLSAEQTMALLEQASFGATDYVGYATTELFPKPLQERFQAALEAGLRQHHLLPDVLQGASS